jgi:hypothetical protein
MNPNRAALLALSAIALLLLAGVALAHVPEFPRDNDSPERALSVPNPAKSWVFYDTLSPDGAAYYELDLETDDRLVSSLFTPRSAEFTPSLVLMSPTIEARDEVPESVTVPDGYGARVIEGERASRADYEPFTPAAFYSTVSVDRRVDAGGTYLIAVYAPESRAGPVGVVVGYEESFSAEEYLTVPFDRQRIHLWEGQSTGLVFGPGFLVLLGGLVVLGRGVSGAQLTIRTLLGLAALLFVAGAVSTAVQTAIAVSRAGFDGGAVLTATFVLIPGAIGVWLLRLALDDGLPTTRRAKVGVFVAGAIGLLTWGGYVLGPVVAMVVAVLPGDRLP